MFLCLFCLRAFSRAALFLELPDPDEVFLVTAVFAEVPVDLRVPVPAPFLLRFVFDVDEDLVFFPEVLFLVLCAIDFLCVLPSSFLSITQIE